MAQRHVTTGIFRVPDLPAALGPAVQVMVTSFLESAGPVAVPYVVNRIEPDGTKTPVREGQLEVGSVGGVDWATLKVWEVEGEWVEVNMDLPFAGLEPSVAVVTSFIGDESTQLALWIGPADFALQGRHGQARHLGEAEPVHRSGP